MNAAFLILSIAGILAVLLRAGMALLLVLRGGAEGMFARGLADSRAQRGDLTGLQEANLVRGEARRRRWRGLGIFSLWVALLAAPPLTPWPQLLYSVYALLWLVPRRAQLRRST
jgi:hypothetical protein